MNNHFMTMVICAAAFLLMSLTSAGDVAPDDLSPELINKLGSADFDERQQAQEQMLEAAQKFYTKLASGLNSDDQEIRNGTQRVLDRLESALRIARLAAQIPHAARASFEAWKTHNSKLLERLGNALPEERKTACTELAGADATIAVPLLAALTHDESDQVRRGAVKALGHTGSIDALPCLKLIVQTPATGITGAPGGAIRVFAAGFNGADDFDMRPVSQIAIEGIGKIKHPDAARFLASGLDNPVGGTIADYMQALAQTEQTTIIYPALMAKIEDTQKLSNLAMKHLGIGGAVQVSINTSVGDSNATVGDLAFSTIITVSGQNAETYGMTDAASNNGIKFGNGGNGVIMAGGLLGGHGANSKTFKDDATRQKGIAQLKTWYDDWKTRNASKLPKSSSELPAKSDKPASTFSP